MDSDADCLEVPYDDAGTEVSWIPVSTLNRAPSPPSTSALRRGTANTSQPAHGPGSSLGGHVYTSPTNLPLASARARTSASASLATNSASSCSLMAIFFHSLFARPEILELGVLGNDHEDEDEEEDE